jgi:hypothetical protein
MVRAALDVADAVAAKLFLEPRLAAPGRVLASLVGQDLARGAIVGNPARERLQHERAPLVVRHHQAHEVARVIIQERRHVHPLVATQQECKEIRLPQLIGLRALEAPLLGLWLRSRGLALFCQAFLLKHPAHRRVRSPDAKEAPHHIANPAASRLRLGLLCSNHRVAARIALRSAFAVTHRDARFGAFGAHARALWITARSATTAPRRLLQRRSPTRAVLLRPLQQRRVRNPQLIANPPRREVLVHDHRRSRHHHVAWPGCAWFSALDVFAPLRRLILFRLHSSSPFGLPRQPKPELEC